MGVGRRVSLLSFVSVCVVCGLLASLLGGQKLDFTSDTTRPRNGTKSITGAKKTQQSVFRNNATARDASFSATASPSLPSRYTPPNYERTPPSRFKDRPLPVQVFEQYQKWHSVESLRRDPHHRHYSIVFYSCPNQAGNRLHHYMNSVVWSILTNRTMLWKYWDTAACQQFGRCTPPYVCQAAKTVHDCDAILSRAPWIPSYDEWHPLLFNASSSAQKNEETEVIPFQIPFHAVHPKITGRFSQNPCYPWGPGDDDTVRGVDVSYNNRTLVYFPELQYRNTYLTDPSVAHELLWSNRSRAINRKLLRFGVDFLYGMLFRNSFELTDAIRATVPNEAWHFHDNKNNNDDPKERRNTTVDSSSSPPGRTDDYYTISLHSRHADDSLDGCNVVPEKTCLQRLAAKYQKKSSNASCVVSLMSDRNCTIATLTPWLMERNCRVLVANHDVKRDNRQEHGPFAGAGFFQDLALATTARSAFVGYTRSSSYLVLELMIYYIKMEAWQRGINDLDAVTVDTCLLGNGRASPMKKKKAGAAASPPKRVQTP